MLKQIEKIIIFMAVLWGSPTVLANSICDSLPSEDELRTGGYEKIENLWNEKIEYGFFTSIAPLQPERGEGKGAQKLNTDIKIAYAKLEKKPQTQSVGSVVISNGRTESYLKYKEMAVTLWCKGYSVYMLDHRGQGLSSRMLVYDKTSVGAKNAYTPEDYINRGHVEDFEFYVSDLRQFVEKEGKIPIAQTRVLLAHSMGGAVAARLIEESPNLFDAAILSSPMLDIPKRRFGCPAIDYFIEERKGEDAYTPDGERWIQSDRYPYGEGEDFVEEVGKYFTSSAARHDIWHEEYAKEKETPDGRTVSLRIGAATNGWFDQACTVIKRIQEDIDKIEIPVLLMIAQNDEAVPDGKQREFCERLNKVGSQKAKCSMEVIPDARHEMFIERDEIRDVVIDHITKFIDDVM